MSAQPSNYETNESQDLKAQADTDTKVLGTWTKSSQELIEQYKNKFNTFKALADDSGYIDQNHFNIGGDQKQAIFKEIDRDGDGKISQLEWCDGWNKLDKKYQENQHKQQIQEQKMDIYEVLEQKVDARRSQDSGQQSVYTSILDRVKNSSSLNDLTNLFNTGLNNKQVSPAKSRISQDYDSVSQINFEIKKPQLSKVDSLLASFKTPNKEIQIEQTTSSGRASYISNQLASNNYSKPVQTKRQSSGKSPVQKFNSNLSSPQVGFLNTSQHGRLEKEQYNSKVQSQMNVQLETKDLNKTNKRKEELQSFMGKIGLGKYDTPKVTISLEQPNNNVLERLRNYVNGTVQPLPSARKTGGLSDLQGEHNFSNNTFKQQMKSFRGNPSQEQPIRQNNRNASNGRDAAGLQEQSLKNFTLKMIHQQKANSPQLKFGVRN
ncbi:histone lysine demethylation [Paramecium bursaria]